MGHKVCVPKAVSVAVVAPTNCVPLPPTALHCGRRKLSYMYWGQTAYPSHQRAPSESYIRRTDDHAGHNSVWDAILKQ